VLGVVDFYPVVSGGMIDIKDVPLSYRWWRRECPVYHPYVLVSYGQLLPNNILQDKQYASNYLKYLELTDEVKLMLDSGGYQVASRGFDIDPVKVLEWQLSNTRPNDIIVPLDYPPPPDTTSLEVIETLAQKTARNTGLWLKAVDKVGGNLKVLVPIHGMQKEAIDIWLKHVKEYIQVTGMVALGGFALKPTSKLTYITRFLMRAKPLVEIGVKYMHVFGAASLFTLAYFHFFSSYTSITMSVDTSKASRMAAIARILFPGESVKCVDRFFRRGDISVARLRCSCPACRVFGDGYITRPMKPTRDRHYAVALHNLFQVLLYYDRLTWYASLGRIEEYLVKRYEIGSTVVNMTKEYLTKGDTPSTRVEKEPVKSKPVGKGDLSRWL
jgi:queuine/archaeosine tRNA-ribosyltransferase